MFGPAFLVVESPHTKPARAKCICRKEAGTTSGLAGSWRKSVHQRRRCPFDKLPLYLRAGSIVPLGPELQYTSEKKSDPITLLIYTGANGRFILYEDDGVTYACERGAHATIPLTWNDSTKTLTIAARQDSFPGMLRPPLFPLRHHLPESPYPLLLRSPRRQNDHV